MTLDRKQAFLWLCGETRGIEQVRGRVRNLLKRWETETAEIELSNKNQCWMILGKGGDTVVDESVPSPSSASVCVSCWGLAFAPIALSTTTFALKFLLPSTRLATP